MQRRTKEMFQRQQDSITDPDETEIGNFEQLEGENIIHDQKMEGGSSKKKAVSRNLKRRKNTKINCC